MKTFVLSGHFNWPNVGCVTLASPIRVMSRIFARNKGGVSCWNCVVLETSEGHLRM